MTCHFFHYMVQYVINCIRAYYISQFCSIMYKPCPATNLPVVLAGTASTRQTFGDETLLMYRPPIFFDAVKSQLLSDGNLIVQVEGKMRLALACILFIGRSTLFVYQFGGGVGGGVSGHIMFRQMFFTRKIELCAPRPADKKRLYHVDTSHSRAFE